MSARSFDTLHTIAATSGGLGFAPVAPGTFGTLGGVAVAVALTALLPVSGFPLAGIVAAVAAALLAYGCMLGPFALRRFGRTDPGAFVLDEVVGYLFGHAITLVGLEVFAPSVALTIGQHVALHAILFVAFRIADITKVWPANVLERRLRGGPGIMFDDVAAGLIAGLATGGILRWVGIVSV